MFQDSVGIRTPLVTAGVPILEIVAPNYISPVILEVGISQFYNLAGQYGFGIPTVAGSGRQQPFIFQTEDPSGPSTLTTAYAEWSVRPTAPTVYIRRATLVAAIGTGVIWAFPRGLLVQNSTSMVLWAIAQCPPCDIWFMIDE